MHRASLGRRQVPLDVAWGQPRWSCLIHAESLVSVSKGPQGERSQIGPRVCSSLGCRSSFFMWNQRQRRILKQKTGKLRRWSLEAGTILPTSPNCWGLHPTWAAKFKPRAWHTNLFQWIPVLNPMPYNHRCTIRDHAYLGRAGWHIPWYFGRPSNRTQIRTILQQPGNTQLECFSGLFQMPPSTWGLSQGRHYLTYIMPCIR